MIHNFHHKELKLFFEKDDHSKLQPHHVEKIRRILLYRLDEAETIDDMDMIGWGLHPLSGKHDGFWSVKVNGNYRIIFCFENGMVADVDYLDYH